jgi:hypothetical protein
MTLRRLVNTGRFEGACYLHRYDEPKASVSSCNGGVGCRLLWSVKWRRVVCHRDTNVSNMNPLPPFCDLHILCYLGFLLPSPPLLSLFIYCYY